MRKVMERAFLMIVAIVFIVGLVGFFTILPASDMTASVTGNVVREVTPVNPCTTCEGDPVCAGKKGKVIDYPNACAAQCDDARVLFPAACAQIPRA